MRTVILFLGVVLGITVALNATAISQGKPAVRRGTLYGQVVVIDPGHGGTDPGSSAIHNGQRVAEDEYVFDVALRVSRMVRQKQGLAFMTLKDSVGERNWEPFRVFPDARTERFSLDNGIAEAGAGLSKRVAYGNQINRKYPNHRKVWISIHFDVLGRNGEIDGVRIIAADPESRIARSLGGSFGNARRLRDDDPVVGTGDRTHGIRRLYVLSSVNQIREKVLIELGNFNNPSDLWRIRNSVVREDYARAIVQGIENH